jgi:hypothetical protein
MRYLCLLSLGRADPSNSDFSTSRARFYVGSSFAVWEQESFVDGSSRCSSFQRPYSLYRGLGGLVSLLLDWEHVETAHYPIYESKAT